MAKTVPTDARVDAYVAALSDEERRADCAILVAMMTRATGGPPRMWGPGIVGFGRYAYTYDSGHCGETCVVGFASRKPDLAIYLADWPGRATLLAKLGKHKMGKACLSVRRLAGVDLRVLEQMVVESVRETRRRWPG
jgi:hypothetical protein